MEFLSPAVQAGLNLTVLETPQTGLVELRPIMNGTLFSNCESPCSSKFLLNPPYGRGDVV